MWKQACDFLMICMQSEIWIQTYWLLSYSNKYFPKQIFMPKTMYLTFYSVYA